LQARLDVLVSIPGVADATAFALQVETPELGALEHKCAASLAGVAPVARDSASTAASGSSAVDAPISANALHASPGHRPL
jgi:Transposase IS116/IS110/IS902 family